jgi:hypothetical protein
MRSAACVALRPVLSWMVTLNQTQTYVAPISSTIKERSIGKGGTMLKKRKTLMTQKTVIIWDDSVTNLKFYVYDGPNIDHLDKVYLYREGAFTLEQQEVSEILQLDKDKLSRVNFESKFPVDVFRPADSFPHVIVCGILR